jgi:hypothetical protein
MGLRDRLTAGEIQQCLAGNKRLCMSRFKGCEVAKEDLCRIEIRKGGKTIEFVDNHSRRYRFSACSNAECDEIVANAEQWAGRAVPILERTTTAPNGLQRLLAEMWLLRVVRDKYPRPIVARASDANHRSTPGAAIAPE